MNHPHQPVPSVRGTLGSGGRGLRSETQTSTASSNSSRWREEGPSVCRIAFATSSATTRRTSSMLPPLVGARSRAARARKARVASRAAAPGQPIRDRDWSRTAVVTCSSFARRACLADAPLRERKPRRRLPSAHRGDYGPLRHGHGCVRSRADKTVWCSQPRRDTLKGNQPGLVGDPTRLKATGGYGWSRSAVSGLPTAARLTASSAHAGSRP